MSAVAMQSSVHFTRLSAPHMRPQSRLACCKGKSLCQTAGETSPDSVNFWLSRQMLLSSASLIAPQLTLSAHAEDSLTQSAADVSASVSDLQQSVQDGANQIAEGRTPVPPLASGIIVFSPLILYGIFVAYRAKLNPRATLTDFAFIVAAIVIVLNLLSILIFKIRLF